MMIWRIIYTEQTYLRRLAFGVFAKSRDILKKVASDNIRVNCIAPGIIKTKFAEVTFDHVYFTKWSLFVVVGIVTKQFQTLAFILTGPDG